MGATVAECGWTGLIDLERDLRAFLGRRCRDESELDDVVQETFLRAARFRNSVQDARNLRGWTLRIGGNVLRDRQRRESRLPRQAAAGVLELESLENPLGAHDEEHERALHVGGRWVEHSEAVRVLRAALALLGAHDRAVLAAYYEHGATTAQIALELDLPRELVKVRLFRARRRLLRRLQAAGWGCGR
ncbi:MAG TPA: sigma-70 family RNA polymerase sigma factor [Planctomycetota bacterium]|nr:sigma-70 family RNA polymerase sigma factor [Planctomycetota bacterium]